MSSKRKMSTRKLTITGMMIAVTVILSYTPLGIIPLQPVSATIVHIPTIIIALLEGPLVGGIVGASFGISSMLQAITRPTSIFSPCFMNPIVSVLPRICIGVVAAYSYKGLMTVTKNNTISAIIASAVGSLTNTLGAMGLIYFIYVLFPRIIYLCRKYDRENRYSSRSSDMGRHYNIWYCRNACRSSNLYSCCISTPKSSI